MSITLRLRTYLRDSLEETKKISWPTRTEAMRYTALVVGITVVLALSFTGLDALLSWALSLLL